MKENILLNCDYITFDGELYPDNGRCVIYAGGTNHLCGDLTYEDILPIEAIHLDMRDRMYYQITSSELDMEDTLIHKTFRDGEYVVENTVIPDDAAGGVPPYDNISFYNAGLVNWCHNIIKENETNDRNAILKDIDISGKPNIICDMSLQRFRHIRFDIGAIADIMHGAGYKVTLVWLVTNMGFDDPLRKYSVLFNRWINLGSFVDNISQIGYADETFMALYLKHNSIVARNNIIKLNGDYKAVCELGYDAVKDCVNGVIRNGLVDIGVEKKYDY